MIKKIRIKNFKSIKDWQEISFEKKSKESGKDFYVNKKSNLLRSIALVGQNASGKSNVIEAITFIKNLVLNSENHFPDKGILYQNFELNEKGEPTEFEITFIINNTKYEYKFSHDRKQILKESLSIFSPKKQKIFERKKQVFSFGRKYEADLKNKKDQTIQETLFLSRASQLGSKILKPVYSFFGDIKGGYQKINFADENNFSLIKKPEIKEKFLDFLYKADFSIVDVELVKDRRMVQTFSGLTEKSFFNLKLTHSNRKKETFSLNFSAESEGTKTFIKLIYSFLDIKQKGNILLIDEIEASLNIELANFVLKTFLEERKDIQIIFSTHNPDLLNDLRSDQIKIIEKKNKVETEIIELYKMVKSDKKINKNYGEYYKEGLLGGQPNLID